MVRIGLLYTCVVSLSLAQASAEELLVIEPYVNEILGVAETDQDSGVRFFRDCNDHLHEIGDRRMRPTNERCSDPRWPVFAAKEGNTVFHASMLKGTRVEEIDGAAVGNVEALARNRDNFQVFVIVDSDGMKRVVSLDDLELSDGELKVRDDGDVSIWVDMSEDLESLKGEAPISVRRAEQ